MSDILKLYKEKLKQNKINSYVLEEVEDNLILPYKDRKNYTFQLPYKRKYHFGEVFNRLLCLEKNKPSLKEINEIKLKLNNNYSKHNIYKNLNYNQRKHLNFIYLMINDIAIDNMYKFQSLRSILLAHLNKFYTTVGTQKGYKYQLVLDIISEHFDYNEFRDLLYFKNHLIKREYIKTVLFKSN